MNSYFQILIDTKGVSLVLIPPKDGGEKIRVQELREYLERIGVLYDPMAINSALYDLKEEKIVLFLNQKKITLKNFGFENNIKSIPLYAVFCIKE